MFPWYFERNMWIASNWMEMKPNCCCLQEQKLVKDSHKIDDCWCFDSSMWLATIWSVRDVD